MTMQIREIVLYNAEGDVRRLPFQLGQVNIITGSSKTGKSSLIDIVEYCLGLNPCTVPVGVIRDTVAWYGLVLQFPDTQCFIARRDPGLARSSAEVYYELADEVTVPRLKDLSQNTTPSGLLEILSRKVGISPNLHEPPMGSTRPPLEANLTHALFLVFQRQDEIAKRTLLFHRQDEQFIPQAIKDTLPYFLGAVQEDRLAKRRVLRQERIALRQLERQAKEAEDLRSGGLPQATTLLAEAENVGLIERPAAPVTAEQSLELLRNAAERAQDPTEERKAVGTALTRLREERGELMDRYRKAREQLKAARAFLRDQGDFTTEIAAQHARLQSVELFAGDEADVTRCPVCEAALDVETPGIAALRKSLDHLSGQLTTTKRAKPRLDAHIEQVEQDVASLQERLTESQRAIDALVAQDREIGERVSADLQRTYVRGRISIYLQNMKPMTPDNRALEQSIEAARARVAALEEELRDDAAEDVLTSILALLGRAMSTWAKQLELEHGRWPLRIDVSQLTIVADSETGPIPMSRMGSGENWVGYHLVTHLALHRWFVRKKRPVPRFLFLDQPTQVYYPADRDAEGRLDVLKDEDRAAVRRMFALLFGAVKALAPELQVIVTDHADLNDDDFQNAIVERWRGGDKLIPASWLKAVDGGSSSTTRENASDDDLDI
jgi:hypothetical protein